jgi:hypothetical protein
MDETAFRILDTLSRELGSTISIRELTSKIKQYHGTAYYASTYNTLKDLYKRGLITFTNAGRSSIPSLNFSSYMLLDYLAEIELRKKREFLERSKTFQQFLMDMERYAHEYANIESISLIRPERNAKLNRAELLILLHGIEASVHLEDLISIHNTLRNLQSIRMIRIDSLPLTSTEFQALLMSEEINPLKEMLANKTTFCSPASFWLNIADLLRAVGKIRLEKEEMNPAKISDVDLNYNLSRFGYRELGIEIKESKPICMEYIITALMMRDEARRIDAIPIILAKNGANYNLLIFLSEKYGLSDRLLGLLRTLQKLKVHKDTASAIKLLEARGTKEIKANEKSIEQKMRLYNAIG